jgi:hypothetical protein
MLISTARWNFDEIQKNFARKNLSFPDEKMIRKRCLNKKIEISDLHSLKDFVRFQISIMRGKITKNVKKSIDDSLVIFKKYFFTKFTRVTEIEIGKIKRTEMYKMNLITNSFGKYTA